MHTVDFTLSSFRRSEVRKTNDSRFLRVSRSFESKGKFVRGIFFWYDALCLRSGEPVEAPNLQNVKYHWNFLITNLIPREFIFVIDVIALRHKFPWKFMM